MNLKLALGSDYLFAVVSHGKGRVCPLKNRGHNFQNCDSLLKWISIVKLSFRYYDNT